MDVQEVGTLYTYRLCTPRVLIQFIRDPADIIVRNNVKRNEREKTVTIAVTAENVESERGQWSAIRSENPPIPANDTNCLHSLESSDV